MSEILLLLLTAVVAAAATPTLAPTGDVRKRTPDVPVGLLFPLTQDRGSQMAAAAIVRCSACPGLG